MQYEQQQYQQQLIADEQEAVQREQQRQMQSKACANQRKPKEVYDRWGVGSGVGGSKGPNVRMKITRVNERQTDGGGGKHSSSHTHKPAVYSGEDHPDGGHYPYWSCSEEQLADACEVYDPEEASIVYQFRDMMIASTPASALVCVCVSVSGLHHANKFVRVHM